MYDSFGAIWRGFQKNSFRFLLVNPRAALQVVLASILLTSYLPVLVWLMLDDNLPLVAPLLSPVPTVLVLLPWYAILRRSSAPARHLPVSTDRAERHASTLFGRKAVWKGRRV